jgi:GDP-L-fucose synthase
MKMLDKDTSFFVAGHRGLVGSAVVRRLVREEHTNIVTRGREDLDLLDQQAVHRFFRERPIRYVIVAAARVGGVFANSTQGADFLYENLVIATNVLHAAAVTGVEKLLFLGSSCIYPRLAPQPIPEDALLTGPLEPTNEGYALAKIAGLKLCELYRRQYGKRFVSAMPTNLYGPSDNYHPLHSHVIPGMMRRMHEAKEQQLASVTVWGTGTPLREFLYVDDLADALYLLMERYEEPGTINVGSGFEVTIRELALLMQRIVGFEGGIQFDTAKPDGTPRKVVDSTRIHALGWRATTDLERGLRLTYEAALRDGAFELPA